MQHVTIGIVQSFDTDPTYMQNAEHIQVLYILGQVRITDNSCIFKMGTDECTHSRFRFSIPEYL